MKRTALGVALLLGVVTLGWNPLFPPTSFSWDAQYPVLWNPDGGTLGLQSNSVAIDNVRTAMDRWAAVPTATLSFAQGPQIVNTAGTPVDVTSANFAEIIDLNNGQNPVIFDNDRDIFEAIGQPTGVVGFGGPRFADGATIVKSFLILEGDYIDGEPLGSPPSDPGEISAELMLAVTVHEVGHFVGLGHTTLNRNIAGIHGCPAPGFDRTVTMQPTVVEASADLHFDDRTGLSELYPTAAFLSQPRIGGHLLSTTGSLLNGGNVVVRPDTADCDAVYDDAVSMQSGSFPEFGGRGAFTFGGQATWTDYTVEAKSITEPGGYPIGGVYPPPLSAPDEFYNGANEDFYQPPDDPTEVTTVASGTSGLEIRLNGTLTAGTLPDVGPGSLRVDKFDGVRGLPPHPIVLDDGMLFGAWTAAGAARQAWVNRFTPSPDELPYRLEGIDVLFWHPSAAPGRPIRLLVYSDPSGSGDPANATLIHSEDTAIQYPISVVDFQEFPLTTPQLVSSGDLYLGVFDLVGDEANSFIATYDEDTAAGRAFHQLDDTAPAGFAACEPSNVICDTDRTWMIRGSGSHIPADGSIALSWGEPCNEATAPGQDFGVYRADLGVRAHGPIGCSTEGRKHYRTENKTGDLSWLVTPKRLTREGSLAPRVLTSTCATVGPDACP